ncbi:hypothetical protein MESS2_790009 [Mesorhizobium metallidurans STM 2683]|uniref:Uncharacterized protein n=1 Tax=Mesorhizobium metallidurans STM 2683 TaxID=1297569 RepID=M5EWX0_9HYPH|nr:hypothetical protein MESS2_790009 [Mesorhizobium metallidurans STM 2683]
MTCRAPRALARRAPFSKSGCLAQRSSGRLASAAVLLDLEVDLLAFDQGRQSSALDCGDVDENVRAARVRLDEAEALGGVKPLDRTSCHFDSPSHLLLFDQTEIQPVCIEILEIDVSKREYREARIDRPKYQWNAYRLVLREKQVCVTMALTRRRPTAAPIA